MRKILLAALLSCALSTQAGVITRTLDFQDNPPELDGRSNFSYGGLRFSPSCRIHRGHHINGEVWLQSDHDNSNCDSIAPNPEFDPYMPPNPDFLGFNFEDFYVDRFGSTFSLLGLAGVGYNATDFTVRSSKGGSFHGIVPHYDPNVPYVLPYEWFTLTGPLWTDITWFTLSNNNLIGWQPHQGWDDIRVSYPVGAPPIWSLLLMALAVGFRFRFKQLF